MTVNTAFNTRVAQCPGCGAALEFKVGHARVVVCEHCSYAVGRSDRGLENLGKVADLVPTGSKLTLGATGRYEGCGFTLAGRLQLGWEQGIWDEWYVALDDGRWGWLAEDDGRYFFSFQVHRRPTPPWSALRVGRSVHLTDQGRFVVTEVREARDVAAKGQLPNRITVGGTFRYADLSGPGGRYATLDYGAGDVPDIFIGREVRLDELELRTEHLPPPELKKIDVSALICPNCQGPVSIQVPDQAKQVSCSYCNALLDTSQGALRYLGQLPKDQPRWLGRRCTLFGVDYLTLGWMKREGQADGERFSWEEYLLYDEQSTGYRFLCCESGHWSFSTPLATGEVQLLDDRALSQGKTYKLFARDPAWVASVLGEFFWSVRVGDVALCSDYVAPPEGLSLERTDEEVSWSHEVYLRPEEVWAAYGDDEAVEPVEGIGALQPSPYKDGIRQSLAWSAMCLAAAVGLFLFFEARALNRVLIDEHYPQSRPEALRTASARAWPPPQAQQAPANTVDLSAPFDIEQGGRNLELAISSDVNQTWAAVSAVLINETTNEMIDLGDLESSQYSGVEGGESWSEGSRTDSTFVSSVAPGRYLLRVESAWEPGKRPPAIRLTLTHGVPRLLHFFLVVLVLLCFPAFILYRDARFESARWEESDFGGADDEDDDDD